MEIKEKAQHYLAEHPNVPQVFTTADGFMFLMKKDAQTHAEGLDSKKIEVYGQEKDLPISNILSEKAKQTATAIPLIKKIEALENRILDEETGANRKRVLKNPTQQTEQLKTKENGTA
ncbi:MAG: hypothetical protein Q4G08_07390 [Capnocytophaga sp.]|nr:hypothetical protein [Capnocytophaga sp.]